MELRVWCIEDGFFWDGRNIEIFILCLVYDGGYVVMFGIMMNLGSNGDNLGSRGLISNLNLVIFIRKFFYYGYLFE